jgi:ABC-type uncharacterized transport system permease subunit
MNDKADPIYALAKILGLFVTAATAEILAPMLGMLLAGMVGGVFGVMSWRKCTRWEAGCYVLTAGFGAWLFAAGLAALAVAFWPQLRDYPQLYQLSALLIGAVGHRWPDIFKWAGRLIKASVEAAVTSRGPRA